MKTLKSVLAVLLAVFLLHSCGPTKTASTKEQAYAAIYADHPLAIAVMPPINKTNNVEAKEFFYFSLLQPLSERGYYVLPPFLTMEMFKTESAYDAELFIDGSSKRFKEVLGADAVLFTTINKWQKAAIASNVTVEVEYLMKSTKTDEVLFSRKGNIVYDASLNSSGGGLFGALVDMAASAINTAATDHIKVARACNAYTIVDMPAGKYNPSYEHDKASAAGEKEFSVTVK